jgi:hypothetical protein
VDHAHTNEIARPALEAPPSWSDIVGGIGEALGGIILALEAAVVFPGLLPIVALTAVALLPFVVLGAVVALPVALALGVWRAAARALGRR